MKVYQQKASLTLFDGNVYLKCLFCHSQVAATVPSYKARLRTVLLKAQLQERIAQIKPVISLSFVCFI